MASKGKPQQQRKSGGMRKYGRNEAKCRRYKEHQTREKNKVKRVLCSNGTEAARLWAIGNGVVTTFNRLVERRGPKKERIR